MVLVYRHNVYGYDDEYYWLHVITNIFITIIMIITAL